MAKEYSSWTKRVERIPDWVSLRRVSELAGLHKDYLSQVKQGRMGLTRTQARKVIKVLEQLEPVVKYKQTELFNDNVGY